MRYPCRLTAYLLLLVTCCAAEEEHRKRAPAGFTGVRGKKSISDETYNVSLEENSLQQEVSPQEPVVNLPINYVMEKRAPSGFFGMRGKKPWNYPWINYPEEMFKRAPMGFVGMRGKKDNSMDDNEIEFNDPSKRAQMGFFGMRGKKFMIEPLLPEKRAPMGFFGMRGKKDFENSLGYFEDKRAPSSGFVGMRGKKQPQGFFGMRGKKYPYEFRGKFVGVRGKKSSDILVSPEFYDSNNLEQLSDNLDINQLMLLLTEQNGGGDSSSQ
ncbi:tachykinins [Anthonomus grandis grandis]|uniref:tachykinins n=1 Tax=Anthonomus grandis grandis TaxID=2921223 RepID=UPI002165EDF0|nr:tachykinins [Anthonomus grandis grandis]